MLRAGGVVAATIEVYNSISAELLPTPSKFHYTFNLRDISKVFQGLLMVLTQCPFPTVSELQLRVDGVNATRCHRDAVDVAVRGSTRLASEPRRFRDAVDPRRSHQ